jgi:hypothetical protein
MNVHVGAQSVRIMDRQHADELIVAVHTRVIEPFDRLTVRVLILVIFQVSGKRENAVSVLQWKWSEMNVRLVDLC